MFEVEKTCKDLGVPKDVYTCLREEIRQDFQNDEIMFELHRIRALRSYATSKKVKRAK
ncbi:MAG: hypothetical protein GWN17_06875 [Candidatus Korarchaeota archaeon]|nr:hypothetical protein [Candidatus Korarchaeota archaeon]